MFQLICLGLFLPLAGFLILLFSSSRIGRKTAGIVGCSTVFFSFICFSILLYLFSEGSISELNVFLYRWLPVARINADFSLHLDQLSLLMTLIITGVGFLIHAYSNGYMDHEEDFARYFACLNFFVFAMLLLVLAGNLLLLFVGWEGVGLASYLLIGFWYHRTAPAKAATKAFVVNRIGDLGLLIGLLLTFQTFGTSDIEEIGRLAAEGFSVGAPLMTSLTLLYFIGAIGKSAQLPLHVWLPDAMEGPTPVSALIHAATMVTAGVYLVVRMHPIFLLAPDTLKFVGDVGAATALFAALCAIAQTDLKRVLAYSTISQLGLMFLACGVGSFYAAMFHLTTHAFVKALLFLSAGNVVHMMHGTTDMEKMGGLRKPFYKTHLLFLIGVLALSGVPPLSAFFSKDLILEQEYAGGFKVLFFIGLIASILTAFYLTRAYCLTFLGKPRLEEKVFKAIKEAPRMMLIPVVLLAVLSIFGGFLGFTGPDMIPVLASFLAKSDITLSHHKLSSGFHFSFEMWLSVMGAFFGVGSAVLVYTKFIHQLNHPILFLKRSFFIDEIYRKIFVRPLRAFSSLLNTFFEPKIFDGFLQAITKTTQQTARYLQMLQSGQVRSYIAWMAIGTVLLLTYLIF